MHKGGLEFSMSDGEGCVYVQLIKYPPPHGIKWLLPKCGKKLSEGIIKLKKNNVY